MKVSFVSVFAIAGLITSVYASPIAVDGPSALVEKRSAALVDDAAAKVDQLMAKVQTLTASISKSCRVQLSIDL